ncbi:MAG: hypothetical protein AMJ81_00665 [Phycisphaerae bacterium SM23_33]|jgi:hypothetical protein|nr:MAG: hypothetical protein AMJ81_00665 [Phycisphaerae bacterium SM23_33]
MRVNLLTLSAAAALSALAAVGCKKDVESISNSDYLLGLQHKAWKNARESFQSGQPQLGELRTIQRLLCVRTPRRIKKDYQGSNKQQVLDKVNSIARKYQAEVASKLDMAGNVVRLAPGVKVEQVKEAFMKLDEEYRQLEAMATE